MMYLALFMAAPLALAAACVAVPWPWLRNLAMVLAPLLQVVAGFSLLDGQIRVSQVGLYPGGVSIPFVVDDLTALMLGVTGVVMVAANWFAIVSGETRAKYYPALVLMLQAGVGGALMTADLFNFFVFMEVMLLPSYGLIAMTGTFSRLAGGRTFVLVNLLTSTMLLGGVALVYGVVGTTNLGTLAGTTVDNPQLAVAMGVVILALTVKAGIFPVHTWLPRTYPGTSPAVMALFSGLHTKVAVYLLYRLYVVVFDADPRWSYVIIVFCIVSMLVGAYAGLAEATMRRVIAYQMVTGMPFILIMLAFTTVSPAASLGAGLFYLVHHIITVGSLTLTTGAIEETYGTGLLSKLNGLARREPVVAAVFVAGAFSIVGLPPFSGTWGKLLIALNIAKVDNGYAWVALGAVVLASIGALLSMLRLWREVFWGKNMDYPVLVPWRLIAPAATLAAISFGIFVLAGPCASLTEAAATALLNVTDYRAAILGGN